MKDDSLNSSSLPNSELPTAGVKVQTEAVEVEGKLSVDLSALRTWILKQHRSGRTWKWIKEKTHNWREFQRRLKLRDRYPK